MARGRKPTLPPKFIEDHGWKSEVKKRRGEWGKKDKYWKNLKTGKICRSSKQVKDIMEAEGIYYTAPSIEAEGASSMTPVANPAPTNSASKELGQNIPMNVATDGAPEQNAVVVMAPPEDINDNNGHGDGGLAVVPPAGEIIGNNNNAHHDGGQEEAAQEQQHQGRRRMRSFDLNVGIPHLWD